MPFPGQTIATIVEAASDPAANNEVVYTPTQDVIVHSLYVQCVLDANVANRQIELIGDDGNAANIFFRTTANGVFTASSTVLISAFEGAYPAISVGSRAEIALPTQGLLLRKGDRLSTFTIGRQVGDDYGIMRLQVEYLP